MKMRRGVPLSLANRSLPQGAPGPSRGNLSVRARLLAPGWEQANGEGQGLPSCGALTHLHADLANGPGGIVADRDELGVQVGAQDGHELSWQGERRVLSRRASQGKLLTLAGQAPSDSTNTSQCGHSPPGSSRHHLRPGLGSWGKDEMGVVPIQGLTWMKQALVRSPRRAKELCRTSGIESWGLEQGQRGRAPLPPTSRDPN